MIIGEILIGIFLLLVLFVLLVVIFQVPIMVLVRKLFDKEQKDEKRISLLFNNKKHERK